MFPNPSTTTRPVWLTPIRDARRGTPEAALATRAFVLLLKGNMPWANDASHETLGDAFLRALPNPERVGPMDFAAALQAGCSGMLARDCPLTVQMRGDLTVVSLSFGDALAELTFNRVARMIPVDVPPGHPRHGTRENGPELDACVSLHLAGTHAALSVIAAHGNLGTLLSSPLWQMPGTEERVTYADALAAAKDSCAKWHRDQNRG